MTPKGYPRKYKANPKVTRKARIKARYGITVEEYDALLKAPCAICGTTSAKRMVLDHCHNTGALRGALCQKCNTGLGHFNDDPALLSKAIFYLMEVPNGN